MTDKELLTTKEAFEIAGVSSPTWYKWQRVNPIKKVRMKGSTRKWIRRKTLMEYLNAMDEVT